jgi:hypothetical protein
MTTYITYIYGRRFAAWLENQIVTIPDEVADDQRHHDTARTIFPAVTDNGEVILVQLDGDAYGLHTPGAGDAIVRKAARS